MGYINDTNEEDWHDYLNSIGYVGGRCEWSDEQQKHMFPSDQFHIIITELQRCFSEAPYLFNKRS